MVFQVHILGSFIRSQCCGILICVHGMSFSICVFCTQIFSGVQVIWHGPKFWYTAHLLIVASFQQGDFQMGGGGGAGWRGEGRVESISWQLRLFVA